MENIAPITTGSGALHTSAEALKFLRQTKHNPLPYLKPDMLSRVLEAFEQGRMREAVLLWEKMAERDDMIMNVKPKREKDVSQLDMQVVVEPESGAEGEAHKEVLLKFWKSIRAVNAYDRNERGGFRRLVKQMMTATSFKYAAHHIIWTPRADGTLSATFEFVPLWLFENTTGKLRYLKSMSALNGEELDESEWMVTTGDGLMIACSIGYLAKRSAFNDWLIFSEKFSVPGVLGRTSAKAGTPEANAMTEATQAFGHDWCAVITGDDGTHAKPIEIIQASGNPSGMPMPAVIERVDRRIAALYRGADLSSMSAGAGDGTGASLQEKETDILRRDDAETIAETLAEVSRLVIEWHFGNGVYPLARVELVVPVQEDSTQVVTAATLLADRGAKVSTSALMDRLNLPKAEDDSDALGAAKNQDAKNSRLKNQDSRNEVENYSSDQPRFPKGSGDDGGEWTDDPAHQGNWKPKKAQTKTAEAGMEWNTVEGSEIQAPLSYSGDYVISHRPEINLFSLSHRPPGQHNPLDNFSTLDQAKAAAESHRSKLQENPPAADELRSWVADYRKLVADGNEEVAKEWKLKIDKLAATSGLDPAIVWIDDKNQAADFSRWKSEHQEHLAAGRTDEAAKWKSKIDEKAQLAQLDQSDVWGSRETKQTSYKSAFTLLKDQGPDRAEGEFMSGQMTEKFRAFPSHRGVKDKVIVKSTPVRPEGSDPTWFSKGRGDSVAEALGGRWSRAQDGYVLSKTQFAKWKELIEKGYDASNFSGEIYHEQPNPPPLSFKLREKVANASSDSQLSTQDSQLDALRSALTADLQPLGEALAGALQAGDLPAMQAALRKISTNMPELAGDAENLAEVLGEQFADAFLGGGAEEVANAARYNPQDKGARGWFIPWNQSRESRGGAHKDQFGPVPSKENPLDSDQQQARAWRGMEHVMSTQGKAPRAVIREDLGEIQFDYGDPSKETGWGLSHLKAKHPDAWHRIPATLVEGKGYHHNKEADKAIIAKGDLMIVIQRKGNKHGWVVTGLEDPKTIGKLTPLKK